MRAPTSPDLSSSSELFLVGYDGHSPPESLRQRFARGDYAGLIFFSRNFASPLNVSAIADLMDGLLDGYHPSPEATWSDPQDLREAEGGSKALARLPLLPSPQPEAGITFRRGAEGRSSSAGELGPALPAGVWGRLRPHRD